MINKTIASLIHIAKLSFVIYVCFNGLFFRDVPRHGIAPEVASYVDSFQQLASQYIPNFKMPPIDIGLGNTRIFPTDDGKTTVGFCDPLGSTLMVVLDREYWVVLSTLEREELVFHELSHCVLNRSHVDSQLSIMYPNVIHERLYAPNRGEYIRELFANNRYGMSRLSIFFGK